jgi:hypothetical protein
MTPVNVRLLYGGPGAGKSTLLAQTVAYMWKTHNLKSRIVGADGGGNKAFLPLINAKICSYWAIDQWDEASCFYTFPQAAKGWWPEDINQPNSKLLPPTKVTKPCPKCGEDSGATLLSTVPKCKSCGIAYGVGEALPKKVELTNGMEEVGYVAFEGLTALGNILMNRLKIVDPTGGRLIKDGDVSIAQLGQQHYGDAQGAIQQMVAHSRTIPTRVVDWTALELRGDDGFGKPVYGPKLPGKALTNTCIAWFTDVIHVDALAKMDPTGKEVRDKDGMPIVERKLFLAKHYPADTKPFGFEAKSSPPMEGGMPVVMDMPSTGNTMMRWFEELDRAYKVAEERMLA